MAFDFKNPFEHLSKPQLYGVIGGSVLLGGFFEYNHHKSTGTWNPFSKGTANASSAGTGVDPVTNLPYSEDTQIDPITGLPYLQEAQEYGSVATAEAAVSAYGQTSATGSGYGVQPASGTSGDGSSTVAAGATSAGTYTSTAAWAQAAQTGLEQISGTTTYNGTDIGTALGDYLQGEELTPGQIQVVNIALAEFPFPGSPPPILKQPVSTPAATVKVPSSLIGQAQEAAFAILSAAGLKATGTPVVKGKTLIVQTVSPKEGTTVAPGTTIHLTSKVQEGK